VLHGCFTFKLRVPRLIVVKIVLVVLIVWQAHPHL
jgi:hypothetical protein